MTIPPNQTILPLVTAPEFNIELLWQLTVVFSILAIIYFIAVFLIRNKIKERNSRTREKKMEFSPMISEFLFYEDSDIREELKNYLDLKIQMRELIKDRFNRKVLIEILLDLRKDLSGQAQEVLLKLYADLGLHLDAYEKLTSFHWPIVSKGIRELTAMNVTESYGMILKLINHRNGTIRKQAELAIVSFKDEGISFFLDNTKYKISEWQQLKLLDVLRHKENFGPPQFSLWLTSNNTHVVLFSLRLIKYYKQSDATKSIITLLKHKNTSIKMEAIDCIKEFYVFEGLPTLKLIYWKSSTGVRIAILDAIGEIGGKDDLEFLTRVAQKEKNYNIKSKVLGTINRIEPEYHMPTKNIEDLSHYSAEIDEETKEEGETRQSEVPEETDFVTASVAVEPKEALATQQEPDAEEEETETASIKLPEFEEEKIEGVAEISEASSSLTPEMEETVQKLDQKLMENTVVAAEPVQESSFDFLPLIVEDRLPLDEEKRVQESPVFNLSFSLDDDFSDSMLDTSEEKPEMSLRKSIGEIDWNALFNPANDLESKLSLPEGNTKTSEMSSKTSQNEVYSISPIFLNDADLEVMVLLEDIADLGDDRELALLYQLLEEESAPIILERTTELIEKFSKQLPNVQNEEKPFSKYDKSVFEALFELSDKETRIVLLKEMATSGGSKEVDLLQKVCNEEDQALKDLAKLALDKISGRKDGDVQQEFDWKLNNWLKIDFELTLEDLPDSSKSLEDEPREGNFFDHLGSLPNNFNNGNNG